LHATPVSHPAVWKNAQGLQVPSACPTEPTLGNSFVPGAGAAGGGGGGGGEAGVTAGGGALGASLGGGGTPKRHSADGAGAAGGAFGGGVVERVGADLGADDGVANGTVLNAAAVGGVGISPSAQTVTTDGRLPDEVRDVPLTSAPHGGTSAQA